MFVFVKIKKNLRKYEQIWLTFKNFLAKYKKVWKIFWNLFVKKYVNFSKKS